MSKRTKLRAGVTALIASAALFATAPVAPAATVSLRLATAAPEKSVWMGMLKAWKTRVADLSKGDIDIELYPSGQLGAMDETLSQMLRGRLDIYTGSIPYLASVAPDLGVLVLPYLFDSEAQSVCVMSRLDAATNAALDGKGEFIAFMPVGWMNISSTTPVHVPSDLAGRKIRSNPLNVSNILLRAYGANPVPIAPAETASALSTGLVSGGDNALAFWASTGQARISKYYLQVHHYLNTSAIVISERSWKKLSPDQQKILHDAADAIAYPKVQKMLDGFEKKVIAKVTAAGAVVSTPTPEQKALWRKAGQGTWDEILKDASPSKRAYLAKIEALKADCN
ncbi:TRAP transporter substrate-binding protein [Acidimangrovimonas pyrenivorans]|uniref:TRAP transporter substrate-binding protein n=1 Tax=Acidimangrovimonas pyrenivorans TaxID=2030798 RepID=A0ABV7AF32_9RHOB